VEVEIMCIFHVQRHTNDILMAKPLD